MKKVLLIFILSLVNLCFVNGQITPFSMNLTPTAQTCTGNGQVAIDITGTQNDAEFEFLIYQLPNTVLPIRTVNGILATGATLNHIEDALGSGNYRLVATQHLGIESNTQTSDFTIASNVQTLSYNYTSTPACNGQNLTVNILSGNPQSYELRNSSNVVVRPAQTSNVFTDVPSGIYNIIVYDVCGNSVSLSVTITFNPTTYALRTSGATYGFSYLGDCDNFRRQIAITQNGENITPEKFPISITMEIENPLGGLNTVISQTWTSQSNNSQYITFPYYPGETYSFTTHLVDACGQTFDKVESISNLAPSVRIQTQSALCGSRLIFIDQIYRASTPFTVTFLDYPPTFDPSNFNPNFVPGSFSHTYNSVPSSITFGNTSTIGVPEGTYTIEFSSCGRPFTRTFTVTNSTTYGVRILNTYAACDNNEGSVYLYINSGGNTSQSDNIQSIFITDAPSGFTTNYSTLPYDVSSNVASNGSFYMNSLPAGNYTVSAMGECGIPLTRTFKIDGANITSSVTPTLKCGSFDVSATLQSYLGNERLYLQKFYPASNQWGHPNTTTLYTEGSTLSSSNSLQMNSSNYSNSSGYQTINADLTNIIGSGLYRVIYQSQIYANGSNTTQYCRGVLSTFAVPPSGMILNNYYVSSCTGGLTELTIDATGVAPLNYTITHFNGTPTTVNNGTNPIFTDLAPGEYTVSIVDGCGQTRIFTFKTDVVKLPVIKPNNLCEGQVGSLNVVGLSNINIDWTKDSDPTVIHNGHTLAFNPFNAASHTGTYYAHLSAPGNPGACINQTLSFQIDNIPPPPNAGTGTTVNILQQNAGLINLFDLLTPPYDNYGDWTDLSNTGGMNGEVLDASILPVGQYQFQYDVHGVCSGNANTIVTINILATDLDAIPDSFIICHDFAIANLGNVLTNDEEGGVIVNPANYTVSIEVADPAGIISVDANGTVSIAAGSLPNQTYTLQYRVAEIANVNNFSIGTLVVSTHPESNPICCRFTVTCPTFDTLTVSCIDLIPTQSTHTEAEFEALGNGNGEIGNYPCGLIHISAQNTSIVGNGFVTRTYTVVEFDDVNANGTYEVGVDGILNSTTCNQVFNVQDTIKPTIACPADLPTIYTDLTSCEATAVNLGNPVVDDNCTVATFTSNAPTAFQLGTTNVIWTVTDNSSNTATCTQVVTVIDTIKPTITCPADLPTIYTDLTSCEATAVNLGNPVVDDNCTVATFTSNAPTAFQLGTTNVIWTVTDNSGNTATCTQVVTVIDTIKPTITCPADLPTIYTDLTSCEATAVNLGNPVVDDNCTVATFTSNAPTAFQLGTTNVIWTVTDNSGNTATCTQVVTVIDTIKPTIACPADLPTIYTDLTSCEATAVNLGNPVVNDNCTVATFTSNAPTAFQLGTTNVIWTVTDNSGNTATCTQVVTVFDTIKPTIACPADLPTIYTDLTSCEATAVNLGNPVVDDNCTVATFTSNAPTAFQLGTTNVIWTVTDNSGNTATCTQVVTVIDTIKPTIACPADLPTIYTDLTSCEATAVNLGNPVVDDNCTVATFTSNAPTAFQLGTTNVIWTVTDNSGNTATCTQVVTVIDTIKPIFNSATPIDSIFVQCTSEIPQAVTITATDNCGTAKVYLDEHRIDGACINQYVIERRWVAVDESFNLNFSAPQIIVVTDTVGPIITGVFPTDTTVSCSDNLPAPAILSATDCSDANDHHVKNLQNYVEFKINEVVPNYNTTIGGFGPIFTDVPVSDFISGAPQDFIDEFAGITVSLFAEPLTDALQPVISTAGTNEIRVQSSKFTVTFSEPVVFTITGNPWLNAYENITFEGDGKLYRRHDSYGDDFFTESAIISSLTNPYHLYNTSEITYLQTAQVYGGLGSTFSVSQDSYPEGNGRYFLALTSRADSILVTMQQDTIPGACPNTFTITRTYSAADLCGNITQHVQTISVVDSIKPVFDIATLPLDTTVNCDAIPSALTTIIASDNCTDTLDVIISVNEVTTQGTAGTSAFSNYTITRTYTATDLCGNAEIFVHTITVQDTVKPIITNCPNDFTHYLAMDSCSYSVVDFTTSLIVTDNCTNSSDLTITQSPAVGTVLNLGQNTITISVDDNSGNIQTCQFEITVVDTIQPIFVNCPPDIYLYATDNSCVVAAQWLEPTVQDNCTNTITVDQTNGGDYSVGTTNVNYIAVDPTGIETTCSFKIIVIDTIKPLVAITDISSAVCVGSPITWTEQISDNCQVQSITSSHVSGSIFPAGTTTVTYTVTDMSDNQTTYSFDVTTNPAPTVALTTDTMEVCINRDVTLSVAAPDLSNTYDWFYNGLYVNSSPDYAIAQVNDNTVGTYVVQATNSHGCIATDTLYLTYDICGIKIVETFSANSDGQNDYFVVQGIEQYPNTEVWIYNRWGTEVYHSTNYQNDWNGKSQSKYNVGGDELPESTYFYVLKLGGDTSLPNAGETFKGYVYMRR